MNLFISQLRTLSKTKNFTKTIFFLFILWYKVILPYVTRFSIVLIFVDERIKIFCVDLFSRAHQKIMFSLYQFSRKVVNFYTRKNLVT